MAENKTAKNDKQQITIYGAGYVGLVSGACFAKLGYSVLVMDINEQRIAQLKQNSIPFYEPGLQELVREVTASGNLRFTDDMSIAANYGYYHFIAVGTPPAEDGSADLQYVFRVVSQIGQYRRAGDCIIINKSTVPVGTAEKNRAILQKAQCQYGNRFYFQVVSNPEFLREGNAIHDFLNGDRVVIGADDEQALQAMRILYQPLAERGVPILSMDIRSAELTKYAANAMLATKVSFINEISCIAEQVGADIESVRLGMGMDHRIGFYFINPGCGYGGSCFPKDIQALQLTAKQNGYEPKLIAAVEQINLQQKRWLPNQIINYFQGDLVGKTIAVWGLSFKPNTDDMREASSCVLLEQLWQYGAKVRVYDPAAIPVAQCIYKQRPDLTYCSSAQEALQGADALAIVTEWAEFKLVDLDWLKQHLKHPVVFDGRNIFSIPAVKQAELIYFSVGRKQINPSYEECG